MWLGAIGVNLQKQIGIARLSNAYRTFALGRDSYGLCGRAMFRSRKAFNAILVITDRFTKVQRHVPARTSWTAEDVANVYITDIWRHYGLPKGITTDRGPVHS